MDTQHSNGEAPGSSIAKENDDESQNSIEVFEYVLFFCQSLSSSTLINREMSAVYIKIV